MRPWSPQGSRRRDERMYTLAVACREGRGLGEELVPSSTAEPHMNMSYENHLGQFCHAT